MNDIIVRLKNGEEFQFTLSVGLEKINANLNKCQFFRFGKISFNTSEIMYIREVESR